MMKKCGPRGPGGVRNCVNRRFWTAAFDPQTDVQRSLIYRGFVPAFQRKLAFRPPEKKSWGDAEGVVISRSWGPQGPMGAFGQVRRSKAHLPESPMGPHGANKKRSFFLVFGLEGGA